MIIIKPTKIKSASGSAGLYLLIPKTIVGLTNLSEDTKFKLEINEKNGKITYTEQTKRRLRKTKRKNRRSKKRK